MSTPETYARHQFEQPDPLPAGEAAQRKCAVCGLKDTNPVHFVNATHHLIYRDGQAARCAYCHRTGVSSQDQCPQAPK